MTTHNGRKNVFNSLFNNSCGSSFLRRVVRKIFVRQKKQEQTLQNSDWNRLCDNLRDNLRLSCPLETSAFFGKFVRKFCDGFFDDANNLRRVNYWRADNSLYLQKI